LKTDCRTKTLTPSNFKLPLPAKASTPTFEYSNLRKSKPVGVEALAGKPAAPTYRLNPLLQDF